MMEEAVGERPAELFMEKDEQQRDLGPFLCQPIGIALSVACHQAMGFQFAKVISEMVEAIAFRADVEGGQEGFVDLAGGPA